MIRLLLLSGLLCGHVVAIEPIEFEGALYRVQRIAVSEQPRLQLRWQDDQGQPLMHFGGLQKQLAREGKSIVFATNAGLYEGGPKRIRQTEHRVEALASIRAVGIGYGSDE